MSTAPSGRRGVARQHPPSALVRATAWNGGSTSRELVPGDVVTLGIGNVVPADIRLLEATRFECDEAVLTGESMPADNRPVPAPGDESDPVPSTCAFMGTIVHQGSARGVVVATGSATAFGRIAVGLGAPPAYTAFQVGLNEFSRLLVGSQASSPSRSSSSTSPCRGR